MSSQQEMDFFQRNAFNPVAWAALKNSTACILPQGESLNEFPCSYPGTPQQGPVTWTCPPGQFCVANPEFFPPSNCTPGFYCPINSIEPLLCPPKFFCSNDTKTIDICPAGKFCPVGTVTPKSCGVILANCPKGSSEAPKFLVILVFLIIAGGLYLGYRYKSDEDLIRERKRKRELDQSALLHRLNEKKEMQSLEKKFTLEFDDLGLKLDNGVEIMKGVTGTLYAGRTCAIMGPSGAGKTTFVTLLTGKVERTSGSVKINGAVDELSRYSKLIGYVPQEDVMIRELTVRDILMHSARTRLSRALPYSHVKAKVNEIISFLGMSHVSNSIIGNEEERGISGGQRKRVNIGMELCAEPSVLFLDEPTSGLDSSTSFEVCQNLRQIAIQQSLTIAAVIHSPSPATFRQFDDFLLLGKGGQIIYCGPREGAKDYFQVIGFTLPAEESPSDFFMDVATGVVPNEYDPAFKPTDLFEFWNQRQNIKNVFAGKRRMTPEEAILAAREYHRITPASSERKGSDTTLAEAEKAAKKKTDWSPSGIITMVTGALIGIATSLVKMVIVGATDSFLYLKDVGTELFEFGKSTFIAATGAKDPVRDVQPFHYQLWFLMKRAFKQVYRGFSASFTDIAMNFAAGLFISTAIQGFTFIGGGPPNLCAYAPGLVYFQCIFATDQLRVAAMFICLGSMFAGISIAGNTFGREKVVYWRDSAAGMPVLAYYIAKFIVDVPRVILGATCYFIAIVMFFPYAQKASTLYAIILMMHFYSFAMGYALSNAVSYKSLALYGTGMALLWSLVLAGVTPSLDTVQGYPSIIRWLWDFSTPRWMVEAFYISEVQALPFVEKYRPEGLGPYKWNNYETDFYNSILITIAWHLIALISLKAFNRTKQK